MNVVSGLISVIIPVYNRQDYIEECLNSVIAQSYQNFEIVIVDDGSSDNTYEICKNLSLKEPRIKLFSGEHGGVSAARNIALDKATGEYMFFLDSDDVIYPALFETFIKAMGETNADMAATRVVAVSQNNWERVQNKLSEPSACGTTTYHTFEESLDAIFTANSPLTCIGGVMMRRDLIGDTKFSTDLFIAEDYYFIYQNLIKGASCAFLKESWYYVRNHSSNSSWNYTFSAFWSRFYLRKLVWESEESFGRGKYANIKKRDAFGRFIVCFKQNKLHSEDSRKMIAVMREYKNQLFPALSFKSKLLYLLSIHFPGVALFVLNHRTRSE